MTAMAPGRYTVSQLSVEFGVTSRTLSKRLELAGVQPVETKGRVKRYRMKDALAVISAPPTAGESTESEAAARARLTRAKADIHEATASQLAGELIPADAVEKAWGSVMSRLRGHLIAMPDRAAPEVVDAAGLNEVREILRDSVNAILTEMAETVVDYEEKPKATNGSSSKPAQDPRAPRPTPRRPRRPPTPEASATA